MRLLPLLVAALILAPSPGSAFAVDHLIKVREVFAGTTGQPAAQYIELQAFNANQHQVAGNEVHVLSASGAPVATFTFPGAVANGSNQMSLLVATPQAATFFGVTPDLTMSALIPAAGGKVCYEDVDGVTAGTVDCVSWGTYSGDPAGSGNPFNPAGGIPSGRSVQRDISGGSNPSALDAGDDSNQSAADFELANASPRNNAGALTSTAGAAELVAGTLGFDAVSGVENRVVGFKTGSSFVNVRDAAAPIAAGAGCQQVIVNEIRCATPVTRFEATLSDLRDTITTPGALGATVDGGAGNDRIITRERNDTLIGGEGADLLDPGKGRDVVDGGAGIDTAAYDKRTAGEPVVIDLDGVADDGNADDQAGALRDNVMDTVERLIGGDGDDTLTGSALANQLTGGPGADTMHGLALNDVIFADGDGAVDTVTCGSGLADHIFSDPGDIFPTSGPDACELVN